MDKILGTLEKNINVKSFEHIKLIPNYRCTCEGP